MSSFPEGYSIYRKERTSCGGGGIFLLVKSDLPSYPMDFSHDAIEENESLWVRIQMTKVKVLHLCIFYKPPDEPASRLDYLADSVREIFHSAKKSHPNIVVAGDFNMGDRDWLSDIPSPANPSTAKDTRCLFGFYRGS